MYVNVCECVCMCVNICMKGIENDTKLSFEYYLTELINKNSTKKNNNNNIIHILNIDKKSLYNNNVCVCV